MSAAPTARRRCAIYTRKSSEEGLEQSFNSLHAQREACEAYVLSQAGEGWEAIATTYDDGGFSGGKLERPAIQQLLADVDAGKIDVVVVYKVDRLTRSLADFAKIVERFDASGVSFVSVTQAFNTTNSMGRLTLNVLLSFAQFEREVTGERIRDKIAASKARGMWMGGTIPLGYDLRDRELVINPSEAATVRSIFSRYLDLGSARKVSEELASQGVLSKAWTTRHGRRMGGLPIERGAILHILQSRLYIGEIVHKTEAHPGLHAPIVARAVFEQVQATFQIARERYRSRPRRAPTALLAGRIFDASGEPMSPSFGYGKQGRLYRYYIAMSLQKGRLDASVGDEVRRVSAERVEAFVLEVVRRIAPAAILEIGDLAAIVERLELRSDHTQLQLSVGRLFGGEHADLAMGRLQARLAPGERAFWEDGNRVSVRLSLPVRLQLRGGRTSFDGHLPTQQASTIHAGLVAALRSAHAELDELKASPLTRVSELTEARAPEGQHRRQLSRLAFLAPDLQRAIIEGRQPTRLNLRTILKSDLPLDWAEQRRWFERMGAV